jgi:lipid II:glycine glycyltransferase (peptidoglycan interpeptide bridge formation enzyme)
MVITDPIYAEKLKELQQQAFERTGGHNSSLDWRQVLKMSQEFPQLSRVAGLFLDEDTSPEKMEAFLWVCNHGDHVEYRAAGSTRRSDVRIPYGYQLAWEMIPWAKAVGAEWFDMGGVTLAEGDRPELDGISRFKRYFSRNVVEVGAEWVLEPSPVRARIAALVSSSASHVNRLMEELRTRSKVRIAAFTNLMS